jgi:NADH-quinone oxidoreductase subunit G
VRREEQGEAFVSDQPQVSLTIDRIPVTVPKGTTVYQAAKMSGIEVPIFCYHDRMPPLGACRMCLVKVEKMAKLQTSCTLEALEGMVVDTQAPDVKAGQEAILEFLLINHPLDCPICDKGGECPLQDQTFKFGPGRSRFVEAKRDFAKPVSLGPVLVLDRERCILCWRCVRFGEIIAGDDALKGFERGFDSEINTPFTLPVHSKFIGNTIGICPVGALTAKSYRFISRPWDNQAVQSTCTLCGVGCAVEFDVRGGKITRTRPSEDPAVNDIWLCDLGFYGHAFVHHETRLARPLIRREGGFIEATWDDALSLIASRLERTGGPRVAMLGGARLTNEDAYVATRFFRSVVGTPHLDHRVDALGRGPDLRVSWGMSSAIEDLARSDCFLLIGCDITETYPVIWLRMKQAVDRGAAIITAGTKSLEIAPFVRSQLLHPHVHGADVVRALAESVRGSAPRGSVEGIERDVIAAAAETLSTASRPIVMLGREAMAAPEGWDLLLAAGEICRKLGVDLNVMRGKGNAFGASLAGLVPDAAPGGRSLEDAAQELEGLWGAVNAARGMSAPEIIEAAAAGDIDVLYVAGADPLNDVPDRDRWSAARARVPLVIVQDAFLSETAQGADVVIPALVAAEKDGTVTSIEGRIRRLRAAVQGLGDARSDWAIFTALASRLGKPISYSSSEEIFDEMRGLIPGLALDARLPARHPPLDVASDEGRPSAEIAGRPYVLTLGDVLFDRGVLMTRSPTIADLAGEPWALIHPEDAVSLGAADGDSVVIASARGSLAVRARISSSIRRGDVYLPRGFDAAPANRLVDSAVPVTYVTVRALARAAP